MFKINSKMELGNLLKSLAGVPIMKKHSPVSVQSKLKDSDSKMNALNITFELRVRTNPLGRTVLILDHSKVSRVTCVGFYPGFN